MDYYSVKEAGEKLGVVERVVRYHCVSGLLEGAERFSGVWLIPKASVDKLVAAGRRKRGPKPGSGRAKKEAAGG